MKQTRRNFLKVTGTGLLAAPVGSVWGGGFTRLSEKKSYKEGDPAPASGLTLNILDFGAVGDGKVKNTAAIQQAIDRCSVMGGGAVVVPAGRFLTGAIALRSHTTLRLQKGAVLLGSSSFDDYPVTQVRWEGKWIQGYTALIYAINEVDIAITGPGRIAGSQALGGRPSKAHPLRHPALIEPIGCNQVRMEGFSTDYHLMWSIHPTYCENIVIKDLTIKSTGGNGDGIDIDSCRKVDIDRCDISTGDDCIAIKSGRGMEGYRLGRTTEEVRITNCTFSDAIFACIGIGSETSGGIRNVHIAHCKFKHARTYAVYIKSHVGRGAFIENISATDLDISGMEGGFLRLNLLGSGIRDPFPVPGKEGIPSVSDFTFTNIQVKDVPVLVEATAIHPFKPLNGFTLSGVTGTCRKGIFMANIHKARIENIEVSGCSGPLINTRNVTGSGIQGASHDLKLPKIPPAIAPSDPPYHLH